MSARALMAAVLVLGSAAAPGQESRPVRRRPGTLDVLDAIPGETRSVVTLDRLFMDVSRMIEEADRLGAESFRKSIEAKEREIELLEGLLTATQRGVSIEIPRALLGQVAADGDSANLGARLAEAGREVEELRVRLRLMEERARDRELAAAKRPGPAAGALTARGQALLDLDVEVPEPPETAAGTPERVEAAADPEGLGNALFAIHDHQGALNAYGTIPEDARSSPVWYRMARAAEHLGRLEQAEAHYARARDLDPEGMWGRNAALQLELVRLARRSIERSGRADGKERR